MKRQELEDKIELHVWRIENNASDQSAQRRTAIEIVQYLIDSGIIKLDDVFTPSGN